MRRAGMPILLLVVVLGGVLAAQRPAAVLQFEIRHAERDVPELAAVLELEPGMTVADIGAGGGAMTMFMAKRLGPAGRVYATEIGTPQLEEIRQLVSREGLENVIVIEGQARSTNLPDACCDAILIARYGCHACKAKLYPYQPQALRNRPTVPAMPYSNASAVNPCPIDTSANAGMRLARAGRLATVRSCPALTWRPAANAASAVFPNLSSSLAAFAESE